MFCATTPKRGDVVVFRWPGDRSQVWVKRVIGLPGDRVELRGGQVWLNGVATSVKADGIGAAEDEAAASNRRIVCRNAAQRRVRIRSSSCATTAASTTRRKSSFRPTICS